MSDTREIYLGDSIESVISSSDTWIYEEKPIRPGYDHAVLFNFPIADGGFEPFRAQEKWDSNHIRLPCSINSKYIEVDEQGAKSYKPRWSLIEETLLREFKQSIELEKCIKIYNARHEKYWKFETLHELVEIEMDREERKYFFQVLLPGIIRLALRLPQLIQCSIPLLKKGSSKAISMTQIQIACLLANAFLCTFPSRPSKRDTDRRESEFSNYPEINFNRLFGCDDKKVAMEKLKCIFNYFNRILLHEDHFIGVVTFQRKFLDENQMPNWKDCDKTFANIRFHVSCDARIEDGNGMLQVDFANKFVGGGVLGHGCVQEEIRFLINPELIIAKLFTECLDPREALIVTGTEQFNSYVGYSSTFKWKQDFKDKTPRDNFCRRKTRIVAIDASQYSNTKEQFREHNIVREINKAYVGFSNYDDTDRQPVCTGMWGAGAFNGHPIKSALIQLIACRATKRNIAFYTFHDEVAMQQVAEIFTFLRDKKVAINTLLNILKKFNDNLGDNNVLVSFIKHEITDLKPKDTHKQQSLFQLKFTCSKPSEKKDSSSFHYKRSTSETYSSNVYMSERERFDRVEEMTRCSTTKTVAKQPSSKPKKPSLLELLDQDFKSH